MEKNQVLRQKRKKNADFLILLYKKFLKKIFLNLIIRSDKSSKNDVSGINTFREKKLSTTSENKKKFGVFCIF